VKLKHVIFIIALIIIIDQVLKIWIKTNYHFGEATEITPWFHLHFIENPGMAWGWKFGNETGKIVLTLFRLAAVIFGTWYLGRIVKNHYHKGFIVCASLIYAGALGNLIDSMFYGMIFDKGYCRCLDICWCHHSFAISKAIFQKEKDGGNFRNY